MADYLDSRGWLFLGPEDIASKVRLLSSIGYANDPPVITAKILERSKVSSESRRQAGIRNAAKAARKA